MPDAMQRAMKGIAMENNRKAVVDGVCNGRIIAIVRGFPPETCIRLAEAYLAGGIRMVEVTFPQSDPAGWAKTAEAIRTIRERFSGQILAGAGTVLTREQLKMAVDAGSQYMITPSVNTGMIREAVQAGLVAIPGAFTPTEVVAAYEAGASFIKLFPVTALGPGYVKALRAPLSHIPLLAVGGITPDNVAEYIAAGCVGAGVSGVLTRKDWIAEGAWDKIADVARRLVERARPNA